jgi:hypothetical protein
MEKYFYKKQSKTLNIVTFRRIYYIFFTLLLPKLKLIGIFRLISNLPNNFQKIYF